MRLSADGSASEQLTLSLGEGGPHLEVRTEASWSDLGAQAALPPSRRLALERHRVSVSLLAAGDGGRVCAAQGECLSTRLWLQTLCPCGGLAWEPGVPVDVMACPPGRCVVTEQLATPKAFLLALPGPPLCLSEPRPTAFQGWGVTFGQRWQCGGQGEAPAAEPGSSLESALSAEEAARSARDGAADLLQQREADLARAEAARLAAAAAVQQAASEAQARDAEWRLAHGALAAERAQHEAAEEARRRNRTAVDPPVALVFELPGFQGRSVSIACCSAPANVPFSPRSVALDIGLELTLPFEPSALRVNESVSSWLPPAEGRLPGEAQVERSEAPAAAVAEFYAAAGFGGAFRMVGPGDYSEDTLRLDGGVASWRLEAGWQIAVLRGNKHKDDNDTLIILV